MNKIRRVGLFGGPGTGKSTMGALLYAHLKKDHVNVEFVQEYVKSWAYEKRVVSSFDQVYLLAKQIRMEDLVLRNGVDYVITDSPVGMSTCYAQNYGFKEWKSLVEVAKAFEDKYPSLNIFMDRGDMEYQSHGRYQTKQEAIEMDEIIMKHLKDSGRPFEVIDCRDVESAWSLIEKIL